MSDTDPLVIILRIDPKLAETRQAARETFRRVPLEARLEIEGELDRQIRDALGGHRNRDALGGHRNRQEGLPTGTRTYGTIALNGKDEICFFAHSRADGVPIYDDGFLRAIADSPERICTHPQLAATDPPELA